MPITARRVRLLTPLAALVFLGLALLIRAVDDGALRQYSGTALYASMVWSAALFIGPASPADDPQGHSPAGVTRPTPHLTDRPVRGCWCQYLTPPGVSQGIALLGWPSTVDPAKASPGARSRLLSAGKFSTGVDTSSSRAV